MSAARDQSETLERFLKAARYARRRHGLNDFDEWDLVSWLWMQYADRDAIPNLTYLRLAVLSYAWNERRKAWRLHAAKTNLEACADSRNEERAFFDLETATSVNPRSNRAATNNRYHIARMLASGMTHRQVGLALNLKRNTVSSTIELICQKHRTKERT